MGVALKVPSKVLDDNFALQDFIDDLQALGDGVNAIPNYRYMYDDNIGIKIDETKALFVNFESGSAPGNWAFEDPAVVVADADVASSTTNAVELKTVNNDSTSVTFSVTNNSARWRMLEIRYRYESEANYDFFKVYINNVQVFSGSGTQAWTSGLFPVAPGVTSVKLVYSKDVSGATGMDAVHIGSLYLYEMTDGAIVYQKGDVIEYNGELMIATEFNPQYDPTMSAFWKGYIRNKVNNISITGNYANAEGDTTTASGNNSHAEGSKTKAEGNNSHSEGDSTRAKYNDSHAEGYSTYAGAAAHAEGVSNAATSGTVYDVTATDNTAKTLTLKSVSGLAVGNTLIALYSNTMYLAIMTISAINGNVVTVTCESATGVPSVTRVVKPSSSWVYNHVEGAGNIATGTGSHAEGTDNLAQSQASHVEGNLNKAIGSYSHAEGNSNNALDTSAHAEGFSVNAYSANTHAEGYNTTALASSYNSRINNYSGQTLTLATAPSVTVGDTVVVMGQGIQPLTVTVSAWDSGTRVMTVAGAVPASTWRVVAKVGTSGYPSHVEGQFSASVGAYSHSEGWSSYATGISSHAEGYACYATGDNSHAEGNVTEATGISSHAEGYNCDATGTYSHAEGNSTVASGTSSHSEGQSAVASGAYSHAQGYSATASGDYSHASGLGTTAQGQYQTVIGKYNVAQGTGTSFVATDNAFIIGNGTGSAARSNAMAVTWGGDMTLAGGATASKAKIGATPTLLTGSDMAVQNTVAGWYQSTIQNKSNGSTASSDFVATADTGDDTVNYIDMGINSSAYADPSYTAGGALSGYLYTNGGDLTIGTQTAGKVIKFHTGGTTSDKVRVTINDTGLVGKVNGQSLKMNQSTADQSFTAATRQYVVGSNLQFPAGGLAVGSRFRWKIAVEKTAAGTNATTIDIATGTTGTNTDTSKVSLTKPVGTAAADTGVYYIDAVVRAIGASCIIEASMSFSHNLANAGFATIATVCQNAVSLSFDVSTHTNIGICMTTGASEVVTAKLVTAEAFNV